MKNRAKTKIEFLPVLGIMGLCFVVLYFLIANLDLAPKNLKDDPYYLFYKLYNKLGYKLTDHHPESLAGSKRARVDGLLIYLDYPNKGRLKSEVKKWVKSGGTLFIAGVKENHDPLNSRKFKTARVNSIFSNEALHGTGQVLSSSRTQPCIRIKKKFLKHLSLDNGLYKENILLYTEKGPLLYRTVMGKGSIIILSDSSLLKNELLREEDLAIVFNNLLKPYFFKKIYLAREVLSRDREVTPIIALLFKDNLLFITLQVIWIMLLFAAWQGKRFGRPQSLNPYSRRTLSEHLKAVGNLYQKTKSIRIIDKINCDYFRYMLNKVTGSRSKDLLQPAVIGKISKLIGPAGDRLERERLLESLKTDPKITMNRLQNKEKTQDSILKALKKL